MILKTIIDRLNQRIEVSNIFDRIYGLCELTGDKGWIYYIGDGQAIPVTDYDSKQGSLFWAKRGKVNISKIDSLKVSGCKQMYSTKFNLSAYAIVRKSHLPCDGEDAGDWVASRVYKLVSGRDYGFKEVIDVVSYEVIPNGYTVGDKTLPPNFEFATVVIDLEVEIVSGSEDTCYDICNTGDIPLPPDFQPCTPCLTEVAVDGITIIGNGTAEDPLIAIGGGGGSGVLVALPFTTDHVSANGNQYVVGNVVWYNGNVYRCIANNDSILPTNASYWVNLGAGFPLVQQPIDWNSTSGNNQILNKPTIPVLPSTIVESVTATSPLSSSGGTNPDISLPQASASQDGYLSSADWSTFDGKQDTMIAGTDISIVGTTINNTAPDQVVSLTAGTGISVSGTYPSFTIDNTQDLSGYVPYTGATQDVDLGTHKISADAVEFSLTPTNSPAAGQIAYVGNTGALAYNMNGGAVTSQIGQTLHAFVHNADSVTITKGEAVYLFGASGNKASVKLANNTADATSAKTFGLAAEDITSGQNGFVIVQGVLDGLNTGAYNAGDTLYLGATNGSLTSVKPYAPNHLVYVGVVEKANNGNGQIYVRIQNGYELDEIHDVDLVTTPPVNNDLLVYTTGANNLWKNKSLGTLLGGTTSQYVRGDGSLSTFPTMPIVYKSTTDTAGHANTTNTIKYTQLIPANTFAAGDVIRIAYRTRKTGTNGNQTLRIYANTTANLSGTPILLMTYQNASNASFLVNQTQRHLAIKTSNNNTEVFSATTVGTAADLGLFNGVTTCAVDWTIDQYLVFTIQNSGSTDNNFGSMYLIERL